MPAVLCKAITSKGQPCSGYQGVGLGGYCLDHYNKLDEKTRARLDASSLLSNLGKAAIVVATSEGVISGIERILEIAGPFLTYSEQEHFHDLLHESDQYRRERAYRLIKSSLNRTPRTLAD